MQQQPVRDRYKSFIGIDCDANAERMMRLMRAAMERSDTPWVGYLSTKLAERARMGQDDLHFIGSQVNALRSFFEGIDDAEGLALLEHLEEHCC
ncbi:N(2)-fixation sustaining protein CowN [Cereibacter changlensis]|uniref:N(2)-fixation sustaining protein CowN n=1 Tax=Cereibacter changlensis TaxID=402884 RepID=A0A4U0Z007_9RHOB|nr:N(2)-fixation sustaining protein CowN [Cereibacter changlensis]TKA94723.1 N(2)-fixation sustaining protein CowN [Cereibacter changlensis]